MSFSDIEPKPFWLWFKGRYLVTGRPTIQVSSIGEHVLNVWMREDGFRFDRIFLTTVADVTPTGTVGPEHPRAATTAVGGCPIFAGIATQPLADTGCKLPRSFTVADVVPAGWKALYWTGQAEAWADPGTMLRVPEATFYRVLAPTSTPTPTSTATSTSTPVPTPTITATLLAEAPTLPTATPGPCAPRPTTGLRVEGAGPGRLRANISASTLPATSVNRIERLEVNPPSNAVVELGGPGGAAFSVTLPDGSQQTTTFFRSGHEPFTVTLPPAMGQPPAMVLVRTDPGSVTVPMVLHDACGPWRTFAGAGADAF
jgi:hypothetical protein